MKRKMRSCMSGVFAGVAFLVVLGVGAKPASAEELAEEKCGNVICEFDKEYTNEWGWIDVGFVLKDEEGNPLPYESCDISVGGDEMIKSPDVVDYYNQIHWTSTDEDGRLEFVILQYGHGDEVVTLRVETNGTVIEKEIYCIDPVKNVPRTPTVLFEQVWFDEYSSVKMSWEFQADADLFVIERKMDDGAYEVIGDTITKNYTDGNLRSGHTYTYRVYAQNYLGNSEMSEEFCLTYVKPLEHLGRLVVDETDILVGESTTLTFRIMPDCLLLAGQTIDLEVYDGAELVGRTVLMDDGAYTNGDMLRRDGNFHGKITIEESVEKELVIRATAEVDFGKEKKVLYSANEVCVNVCKQLPGKEADLFGIFEIAGESFSKDEIADMLEVDDFVSDLVKEGTGFVKRFLMNRWYGIVKTFLQMASYIF